MWTKKYMKTRYGSLANLFGLTKDGLTKDCKKFLNFLKAWKLAPIDAESQIQILPYYPSKDELEIDPDKFYEENKENIDADMRDFTNMQKRNLSTEKLYKQAFDNLNFTNEPPKEIVTLARRNYHLSYRPDKASDASLKEENIKRLLLLETNYKIIENYRKPNGSW